MNLTVPVTEVNSMETIKIINNIAVVTPSIKTISVEYEISQYCIKAVMKKLNFMSNNGNIDTITRFLLVNAKWVHFGESVRHPFWIILFHNTYISKFTRELYLLNIPPLCYQFVLHTFIY